MKLSIVRQWSAGLSAALVSLTAFGAESNVTTRGLLPPPTLYSPAGLQVSLSTGGYKFIVADDAPAAGVIAPDPTSPASFPASIVIYNRSAVDIPVSFPDPASAARRFNFSVFDSAGALVWQSDSDVIAAQVITEGTLGKRSRWSRNIAVPLKIEGTALAEGVYTLVASLASSERGKQIGASAIFEVARPADPTAESGINGLVLKATGNPPEAANPLPAEVPAAGALVNVSEIRLPNARYDHPPFIWNGRTDASGRFKVRTASGRYRVTATLPPSPTDPAAGVAAPAPVISRTVEVTVEEGRYADITIHLPAPPPPPVESGIKGLVLYGPITPVAVVGVPNEAPAVGAPVSIVEILPAGSPVTRLPFRWFGRTNNEGRFQARTPAGRFKVTATLAPPAPTPNNPASVVAPVILPPSATVEVTVVAGQLSEVTLNIDTGIR